MNVLVTGGAGFIGNNLIRRLLRESPPSASGDPVNILNLDALTYAANMPAQADLNKDPRYQLAKIDLRDADSVHSTFEEFQPNWVIHLAAESHVDRSINDPGTFIQTNIVGSFNLLQAARAHYESLAGDARSTFRLLHVSTDEVYGSLADHGKFAETTAYDPHSPYAASKAAADHLSQAWHVTYGLPVLSAHASNNFGPFQHSEKLIPTVILNALSGKEIPIYGDGQNTRDWLYVEDCVEALCVLVARGRVGESYNVGASNEWTNIELARQICKALDTEHPHPDGTSYTKQIKFVADRLGHDFRYAIDASKLHRELGWEPRYDFDAALRETVRWYLRSFQAER
jgi:dTDP-glucose 4,6-dehydratase